MPNCTDCDAYIQSGARCQMCRVEHQHGTLTDGGRKTAYRPPCDAVENWSSRAPWDRIERRVCPNCRYYFDTKATSGQVFCGDACRQRHERGEFL
jgi:hypothetical protein